MIGRTTLLLAALVLLDIGSREGDAAFLRGEYGQAAAEYQRALERDPASTVLHYNLAAALLHLERYDDARRHLLLAAGADRPSLRRDAHYNRGNGGLFSALDLPPGPERDDRLRSAIEAYREALLVDSSDLDAKWNLELAELLLSRTPPASGGGGGGGGAGDDSAPAQPDPSPAADGGPQPRMTAEQAEQLLNAAANQDRQLQREKLRRGPDTPSAVRDW